MIPCPYCERGFEKRAGLMRHVTASHHSEGVVPTNPGGAIEPLIPADPHVRWPSDDPNLDVEPETYAESLTDEQLAPGQEPYVDPPIFNGYISLGQPAGGVIYGSTDQTIVTPPVHLTADVAPTAEQYTRIRALRRQGRPETEAWMTVVGYPPPPSDVPAEDLRPLRLQQVAFRVREGNTDHIDATWLLRLAEIGRETVDLLDAHIRGVDVRSELLDVVDRWNETIA